VAKPLTGQQAEGALEQKKWVRACETPEFYAQYGCPHGRDKKAKK